MKQLSVKDVMESTQPVQQPLRTLGVDFPDFHARPTH